MTLLNLSYKIEHINFELLIYYKDNILNVFQFNLLSKGDLHMIILLDAMGGDNAPDANIKGAVAAINQIQAELWLIGKEEVIKAKLKEFYNKTAEEISPRLKIYTHLKQLKWKTLLLLQLNTRKILLWLLDLIY